MSNYEWLEPRRRNRHLLIVEGNHEKNKLMELLLKCFPEIDMAQDDILIYGTNIYILYQAIETEYQEDWYEQEVDLPYVVSQCKGYEQPLHMNDFVSIIMFFDYERHDPNFSEEKIEKMQNYFIEATDVGKLYLNYPMVESYRHFSSLPDGTYEHRYALTSIQSGAEYKNLVKDTFIAKAVHLPTKMEEILEERFNVSDELSCKRCVELLLEINSEENLLAKINFILSKALEGNNLLTASHQMYDIIQKCGYAKRQLTYYEYMRTVFAQIIAHNICKANKIQRGEYNIEKGMLQNCFETLEFEQILKEQNQVSRDELNGFVWVLNTSVFFVPDYKFQLIAVEVDAETKSRN